MSRSARILLSACLALALAACAGAPVKPSAPLQATGNDALTARRAAVRDWAMDGRIAVASAGKGGSGGIQWRQDGTRYTIVLSAPVTGRNWTLTGDEAGARLDGLDGGTRSGPDVEVLLGQATGWQVPFRALASWMRGIAADPARYGPAQVGYGVDGQPARIEQAGWTITYQWPAEGQVISDPALPQRVAAVDGDAKVRVAIDQWQLPGRAVPAMTGASQAGQLREALAGLDLEHPEHDMQAHVASGDLRPVGVCGFACLPPGFDLPVPTGQSLRILPGTGDVVEGADHERLLVQANDYATAYNQALARWLAAHPPAAAP